MPAGIGGREDRLHRRAVNLLASRARNRLGAGLGDDGVTEPDRSAISG